MSSNANEKTDQNVSQEKSNANVSPEESDAIETDNADQLSEDAEKSKSMSESSTSSGESPSMAANLIKLLIPVSICMLIVIIIVKSVLQNKRKRTQHTVVLMSEEGKDTGGRLKAALVNALILISVVIVMTIIFVTLFIYRCYRCIFAYLFIAITIALFYLLIKLLKTSLNVFNISIDYITIVIFVYNYCTLGLICIFWKGPKLLQRSYLVMYSALFVISWLEMLPLWTVWVFLIVISIWDLFAVLPPFGPLRIFIETVNKRKGENEEVDIPPGLIYTAMLWTFVTESVISASKKKTKDNKNPGKHKSEPLKRMRRKGEKLKAKGSKLGLGDFIFYSILIGAASLYGDWNIIIGCFLAILVGLGLTLLLLLIFQRPLPALPISILFGVLTFLIIYYFTTPFTNQLQKNLIFI